MANVHPTAIVDRQAQLHESVDVGPGCVISGRVTIDRDTRLLGNVYLQGPMTLGRGNVLYPFVCLGFAPQDRKFDPTTEGAGLVIGDDNRLREGVTIHRATGDEPTTIGHRNYFMANSHAGHDARVGSDCTFANGVLLAGHVHVADRVLMGGNAVLHQFCRIGRLAVISGLRGLTLDLPPFCICYDSRTVGSLNLVGLRRAGLRQHIKPLQRAFDILFRSAHANTTAVARIEEELGDDPLCMEMARFVRESRRGIATYQPHREAKQVPE